MTRSTKALFVLSFILLVLSYPTCQFGDKKVQEEMAKYPPSFVEAHYFDLIFLKWALPGIWLFSTGLLLILVAVFLWVISRRRVK